jgi:hypothetical protein
MVIPWRSRISFTIAWPSAIGDLMAVTESDGESGAKSSRPIALAPARVAFAIFLWRPNSPSRPSSFMPLSAASRPATREIAGV